MAAAYDSYDYPSYWIGRDYEHLSEISVIKDLLTRVKKIKTILEIGSGFGRLVPFYSYRAKKIILSDPSTKLLGMSKEVNRNKKKFKFIRSTLENLPKKIRPNSIDLIILVRVIHHLENVEDAFKLIRRFLKPNGYFLLEFANKANSKATIKNILKGNFVFPLDIFTTDLRSLKSIKNKSLPFFNYHPHLIKKLLNNYKFEIIDIRSASNTRSQILKKLFSVDFLLYIEKLFQRLFSLIYFGPSIFVLSRKRG